MHRLFVAIRPPDMVREQLLDIMEGMPDMRWQHDEQLHLTLRFVGEVERPVAEDLSAALRHIRFDRFSVGLDGAGKFEKRRHGALWAGLRPKEQLKALNAKVERACQSAGLEPERRAYMPHITLARWKGRAQRLDAWLERHGGLTSEPWQVTEFILFESHLGREAAHYEPVETYQLASCIVPPPAP
jgi:2'-5' RNA ligase